MSVEEYLNSQEAGRMLRRSPAALRNLVMRRRIPFRKVAGRLMFIRSELERWVNEADGVSVEEVMRRE